MSSWPGWFPSSYEESRHRFRDRLAGIQQRWSSAQIGSRAFSRTEDVTTDWISAEPTYRPDRLLVFTCGEHGIEGSVGAAMLQLLLDEFLPALDPSKCGLLLIHAVNPWGMKHRRRTNARNVDLNRNFLSSDIPFDPDFNPDYALAASRLIQAQPLASQAGARRAFAVGLARALARLGPSRLREATLIGQYRAAQGLFYGGTAREPETLNVIELLQSHLPRFAHTVLLDMHTGYGPRRQMTLVNSVHEPRPPLELSRAFGYPRVVRTDPASFYRIQGDMIDFVYTEFQPPSSPSRLFATSFEFGTRGDSWLETARSLRAMVLENQVYWHGAPPRLQAWVQAEMEELYNPSDETWRAKAVEDARRAFEGILRTEGILGD